MLKSSKILTVLNSKPFALWAVVKITSIKNQKKKKTNQLQQCPTKLSRLKINQVKKKKKSEKN